MPCQYAPFLDRCMCCKFAPSKMFVALRSFSLCCVHVPYVLLVTLDDRSRLPRSVGEAADAKSADTKVKVEDVPTVRKFQSQNARILGYVYQKTNGRNHGTLWKIQLFLLGEFRTVRFFSRRTIVGTAI